MQHEELRDRLLALGWRIAKNNVRKEYNEADWYAWQANRHGVDWPDCECNDKPPSIIIEPHQFQIGEHEVGSVEFIVTGEAGGNWYNLRLYSVPFHDVESKIGTAIKTLGAAWGAIVEAKEVQNA